MRAGSCPKCGSGMAEGFLIDRRHQGTERQVWVEGEPVRVFFGLILKVRGRTRYQTTTRRCERCGYLESFAQERLG